MNRQTRLARFLWRLLKSGERWSVIANVDGTATDVNSVDFAILIMTENWR